MLTIIAGSSISELVYCEVSKTSKAQGSHCGKKPVPSRIAEMFREAFDSLKVLAPLENLSNLGLKQQNSKIFLAVGKCWNRRRALIVDIY